VVKNAAEAAAKNAAKASAKNAAKNATEAAAKNSSNFIKGSQKNAKSLLKRVTQSVDNAKSALTSFVKKNPGLVIGGLAVTAAAAYALDKFMSLNDKTYTIISINAHKMGGIAGFGGTPSIKIEYQSQGDKLRTSDTIVVTNSNSVEIADGGYIIQEVNNTAKPAYLIANYGSGDSTKMPNVTKPATSGNMMYKTTFESQIGGLLGDAAEVVGKGAGDVIAGASSGLLGDAFKGLEGYKTPIFIFLVFIVIIILFSIMPTSMFSSKSGGTEESIYIDYGNMDSIFSYIFN
jgi:hypothetical protein